MKYFMQPSATLENGPGGKPVTIGYQKEQVSEEEFFKHIDEVLEDTGLAEATQQKAREEVTALLNAGKTVTIGDYTLSIKI